MEWEFIWQTMMVKKLCLVYMTHDGVISQYCGIGALTQTFLGAIEQIRLGDFSIDMYLIGIDVAKGSLGYARELFEKNIDRVKSMEGDVILVDNNSSKKNQYGEKDNRYAASLAGAAATDEIISRQYEDYDMFVVFCVDTPFLWAPMSSVYLGNDGKVLFAVTLHSTGDIHQGIQVKPERMSYEKVAFEKYINVSNVVIVETSKFLGHNLTSVYGVPYEKLMPLHSGVLPYASKYSQIAQSDIRSKLLMYGIDPNKPICFSMGRAEGYKGFDILIGACETLMQQGRNIFLVILCSPYTADDAVLDTVRCLLQKSGLAYILIDRVDFDLPKYICQWHNTKIVAQISLKEPFGLIPEDVRCRARNGGPVILTSSRDGYVEQITDGYDGFLVEPNPDAVAHKMLEILNLDSDMLLKIRENGFIRACDSYDYASNLEYFLVRCLSRHA